MAVNRAWRQFAKDNSQNPGRACEGINYFEVCKAATGTDAGSATQVLNGIHAVLRAEISEFVLEYPCPSPRQNRWFMLRATRFIARANIYAVLAHTDITAQKAADEQLRRSEERFRAVVENAPAGIFVQEAGRFVYANALAAHLLGAIGPSELVGKDVAERFEPGCRDGIMRSITPSSYGWMPGASAEAKCVRVDGTLFDAQVAAVHFTHEGRNGALVFFQDITERMQLEAQLHQAVKMEAVGHLAGGVAHDFNNILSAVLMHLGFIQHTGGLTAIVQNSLRELEKETLRAANLTRQLLVFSRRQAVQTEPLDLTGLVQNLLCMLRRLLDERIKLSFEGPANVWVNGDAGMLEQVVTNLCINARDAMPEGGELTLAVSTIKRASRGRSRKDGRISARFVRLRVSDTGCGMSPDTLEKIFDPFFTTKAPGKGTGLGLATVARIVKQHAGWVQVSSHESQGSVFDVFLPLVGLPLNVQPGPLEVAAVTGGEETILFVEDEVSLRRAASLCLRKLGYGVLEASDGAEAVEIWRQHQHTIALVVTDQVMPGGMSGRALARRLKQDRPDLKIILSSGYEGEKNSEIAGDAPMAFLAKPYPAAVLAAQVRQCLDNT